MPTCGILCDLLAHKPRSTLCNFQIGRSIKRLPPVPFRRRSSQESNYRLPASSDEQRNQKPLSVIYILLRKGYKYPLERNTIYLSFIETPVQYFSRHSLKLARNMKTVAVIAVVLATLRGSLAQTLTLPTCGVCNLPQESTNALGNMYGQLCERDIVLRVRP